MGDPLDSQKRWPIGWGLCKKDLCIARRTVADLSKITSNTWQFVCLLVDVNKHVRLDEGDFEYQIPFS